MAIDVTLLGTGSPLPNPDAAGPATLVHAGDATLLVDAGRGVVMRLAAAGVLPSGLTGVLLTHLHSDHISDLNDVITSHWVMHMEPVELPVFGPPGTARVVQAILDMLGADQRYRLDHHDDLEHPPRITVTEVSPGDAFVAGDAQISVHETDHRPVRPTVGYRVEHGGAVVALAGDTVPCAGLDDCCADADVYVQTVIRRDLVALVPNQRFQDIIDYHSSVEQAGETAARNRVGTLVLTHYVPPLQPGQEDEWRALAAAHFDGEIVVGPDLTSVTATPR